MADSIASVVDLLHPTPSGIGVITTDQVWIVFDREIDETTLSNGNFFVTGPDNDTWLGPDLQLFHDAASMGDEDSILQSPGFDGIAQGIISFERIDPDTLSVVATEDTVGSGTLYRTKAIFTPTNRLQANTEYEVYLSGDEAVLDSLKTGISERTVFDTVPSGVSGTGEATFTGGYNGFAGADVFSIEITVAGEVGDAKFTFSRDTDPFSVFGPFKTKRSGVLLADGVVVDFTEGDYEVGDSWSAVVKEQTVFEGNLHWSFKTGSGTIESIPDTTATSVLGDPAPATTTSSSSSTGASFSVLTTDPADEDSHVTIPRSDFDVTITFDADVDDSTVVDDVSYSVVTESVTGDTDVPASGVLTGVTHTTSGAELTLTIPSGMLLSNNLVTITLDDSIRNTSGTSLGAAHEFWFTTNYNPMYCTERRLRVMIGAFIKQVARDTINMAIHLASLEADPRTWNRDNMDDNYYQFVRGQWTCCTAAAMLLTNTVGGAGNIKKKKLGDLEVEYNTDGADTSIPLQRALDCIDRWEGALQAGGRQVQKAKMVVKGDWDPDRPAVGRLWLHGRSSAPQTPSANTRVLPMGHRRIKNVHHRIYRKGWWR